MKKVHMTIAETAKYLGCTVQNVYDLVRRLSLKARKHEGKLYTCQEWIDEYQANYRSKQLHSTWNGRKVFDRERGEYSIQDVAKILNTSEDNVEYWVRNGRLKTIRKGFYRVIMKEELERFAAEDLVQAEVEA